MPRKRPDGRIIKNIEPFDRIIPYIIKTRNDSMLMYQDDFDCAPLDDYIKEKRNEGIKLNYMHIFIAATVRLIALRPKLNRFIMNGRMYARPKIWVSFAIHRALNDEDVETTLKLCFDGTENILDIAKAIDEAINNEIYNAESGENDTDKVARILMKTPSFLIKAVINFVMCLDKHNMMPRVILDASPFHTSFFMTNLKSLGINHIFHHIYNFGTTGIFLAMGKEQFVPVVNGTEIVREKRLGWGMVADERYCDGLYFAKALRMIRRFMKDPAQLETRLEAKVEDVE